MNTTLPTEPEIAALAEELRSEDSAMYIKRALMALCRRYEAYIAANMPAQPPAPIDYTKPVVVHPAPRREVDNAD